MPKPTHREVKFTKEEMEYDIPGNLDFNSMPYLGRGQAAMETARRISKARGGEKRRLIASLPRGPVAEREGRAKKSVDLEPDVAAVFKDSASVNKALRAILNAVPALTSGRRRKTA